MNIMNSQTYSICVLGSLSFDQYLILDHFPAHGETIQTKDAFFKNGGKGANQAVACSRLETKTCFAGQIGSKPKGLTKHLVQEMTSSGLHMEYLRTLQGIQTGQAIIMLNKFGENSIVIIGGSNIHYPDLSKMPAEYYKAIDFSRLLLLQKEIPLEINMLAAAYAKSQNKIVGLDCGGRDEPLSKTTLQNIDFISPNETELLRLIEDLNLPLEKDQVLSTVHLRQNLLHEYKQLNILLKLGSNGCKFINMETEITMPTVSQINPEVLAHYKIIDTTGAGDCFTGAFFVKFLELLNNRNYREINSIEMEKIYKESMFFANSSAFLCITVMGAMPSMPKRLDVESFISRFFPNQKF